jgi:hypothetical protein
MHQRIIIFGFFFGDLLSSYTIAKRPERFGTPAFTLVYGRVAEPFGA